MTHKTLNDIHWSVNYQTLLHYYGLRGQEKVWYFTKHLEGELLSLETKNKKQRFGFSLAFCALVRELELTIYQYIDYDSMGNRLEGAHVNVCAVNLSWLKDVIINLSEDDFLQIIKTQCVKLSQKYGDVTE